MQGAIFLEWDMAFFCSTNIDIPTTSNLNFKNSDWRCEYVWQQNTASEKKAFCSRLNGCAGIGRTICTGRALNFTSSASMRRRGQS